MQICGQSYYNAFRQSASSPRPALPRCTTRTRRPLDGCGSSGATSPPSPHRIQPKITRRSAQTPTPRDATPSGSVLGVPPGPQARSARRRTRPHQGMAPIRRSRRTAGARNTDVGRPARPHARVSGSQWAIPSTFQRPVDDQFEVTRRGAGVRTGLPLIDCEVGGSHADALKACRGLCARVTSGVGVNWRSTRQQRKTQESTTPRNTGLSVELRVSEFTT